MSNADHYLKLQRKAARLKSDADHYLKLQRKAARLKSDADRAQGAYDTLLARLRETYGVDNLKAAKALRDKLEREATAAETAYHTAADAFATKWAEVLGDDNNE